MHTGSIRPRLRLEARLAEYRDSKEEVAALKQRVSSARRTHQQQVLAASCGKDFVKQNANRLPSPRADEKARERRTSHLLGRDLLKHPPPSGPAPAAWPPAQAHWPTELLPRASLTLALVHPDRPVPTHPPGLVAEAAVVTRPARQPNLEVGPPWRHGYSSEAERRRDELQQRLPPQPTRDPVERPSDSPRVQRACGLAWQPATGGTQKAATRQASIGAWEQWRPTGPQPTADGRRPLSARATTAASASKPLSGSQSARRPTSRELAAAELAAANEAAAAALADAEERIVEQAYWYARALEREHARARGKAATTSLLQELAMSDDEIRSQRGTVSVMMQRQVGPKAWSARRR